MKNIQHGLDFGKQLRKAYADYDDCVRTGQFVRAAYVLDMLWDMYNAWLDNLPRPWSDFRPTIEEEFSEPLTGTLCGGGRFLDVYNEGD